MPVVLCTFVGMASPNTSHVFVTLEGRPSPLGWILSPSTKLPGLEKSGFNRGCGLCVRVCLRSSSHDHEVPQFLIYFENIVGRIIPKRRIIF